MPRPYFTTWIKQNQTAELFSIRGMEGPYIITESEGMLADLTSVSYQASFGQHHPHIAQKIKEQTDRFCVAHPKAEFELKTLATQRLLHYLALKDQGRIFYTLSGAESVENALKMARQLTGKKIVLARRRSYHGATLGALSVTGDWRNPLHATVEEWTVRIPEPEDDPQLKETRRIIESVGPENICGFCLESITGGNGVIIPSREWWSGIQSLCDEFQLELIVDEVICGFHRTGTPLGLSHYPIRPDYICLAKAITGGMVPFGALWVKESKAQRYDDELILSLGLTSYAHPLGLAAMTGVLDLLESPEFLDHLQKLSELFSRRLEPLRSLKIVQEIRSIGLLAAIDLKGEITQAQLHQSGLHAIIQKGRLILAPAFTYSQEQLDEHLEALTHLLESL